MVPQDGQALQKLAKHLTGKQLTLLTEYIVQEEESKKGIEQKQKQKQMNMFHLRHKSVESKGNSAAFQHNQLLAQSNNFQQAEVYPSYKNNNNYRNRTPHRVLAPIINNHQTTANNIMMLSTMQGGVALDVT